MPYAALVKELRTALENVNFAASSLEQQWAFPSTSGARNPEIKLPPTQRSKGTIQFQADRHPLKLQQPILRSIPFKNQGSPEVRQHAFETS